jgi:hypothetical protein
MWIQCILLINLIVKYLFVVSTYHQYCVIISQDCVQRLGPESYSFVFVVSLFILIDDVKAGVNLASHVDGIIIVFFEDKVKAWSIIYQGQVYLHFKFFFLDTFLQSLRCCFSSYSLLHGKTFIIGRVRIALNRTYIRLILWNLIIWRINY